MGHKYDDCWDNPKNKGKRPKWYKKTKTTATAVSEELQLSNVCWGLYEDAFDDHDDDINDVEERHGQLFAENFDETEEVNFSTVQTVQQNRGVGIVEESVLNHSTVDVSNHGVRNKEQHDINMCYAGVHNESIQDVTKHDLTDGFHGTDGDYDADGWQIIHENGKDKEWHVVGSKDNGVRNKNVLALAANKGSNVASLVQDPNVFIFDSGASTHSTGCKDGMYDLADPKGSQTQMGDGVLMYAAAIGKLKVEICSPTNEKRGDGTLVELHYIPKSPFNIISGTKLQLEHWKVHGNIKEYVCTHGSHKLVFNMRIDTTKGALFACCMNRKLEFTAVNLGEGQKVSISEAHRLFGHMDKEATRKAAEL